MNRKFNLLVGALLLMTATRAQNTTTPFFNYASAGLQYFHGTSIGNTFKRLRDAVPVSGEVYFQKQINPSPAWNHTRRLPQWGMGVFATNSGSRRYVGTIVCVYPYIRLPLFTLGGFQSDLRFAFGLGWVQKPYNRISNPENLLLSQKINPHSNLSWLNEIRINDHNYLGAALSFYHVSNAKTSLPNLGINIPSVSIGYRYAFGGDARKPAMASDSLNRNVFYRVFLSAGVKQMQVPDSSYYFVKVLSGEVSKQISYSSTLSLGMFLTHDASVRTDTLVKHLGSIKTSQVAVYGSYEYNFGRLIIPVQFGVFVYNSNSNLLESVGIRYRVSDQWQAEMMLKAHGHKADLMHFGVGYRFPRNRSVPRSGMVPI